MTKRLANKVAIVTGAAQGIGLAIAQKLAAEGAHVVIADIREPQLPETTDGSGATMVYRKMDVCKSAEIRTLFSEVVKEFGSLDILVNNAGIMYEKLIEDTSEEDWDLMMNINLKGVFLCTQAVIKEMRKSGGGSIINIGSIEGLANNPLHAAYAASKSGVHGLTRATAVDQGQDGIRCNAVCPGWINTELNEAYFNQLKDPDEGKRAIDKLHPVGRMGTPADVGDVVCWLASKESAFVTGQEIVVDGGRTARPSLADFDSMEKA
jgi:NAD(P)-dependent dehydrogenase (short-subunit alcohol dehydrogenase family)